MKICFVWHCSYPWDVRLEKLVNAVVDSGHKACVVAKGKKGSPQFENNGPITIRRVDPLAFPMPRLLRAVSNYPLFFNPVWSRAIRAAIEQEDPDVLVVRDLPLALLVARLGRRFGKPVVFDMAENYPAALLSYQNKAYGPLLVGNAWLPRWYERFSVSRVDRVLVVAAEQRDRLLRSRVNPKQLTLVGNTPTASFLHEASLSTQYTEPEAAAPNLLYVGFIDPHRGVDVVIRAVPELLRRFPNLTVTIVGDGTARRGLIELSQALGVQHAISFPGWAPFDQLPRYIRHSTICLIPHLESEHTNTTLPNKLFEYMAFAKPVLASSCRPMQRIIEAEDCGVVFKSGDTADFIRRAKALLSDPRRYQKGRNGQKAIERTYSWSVDKAVFLNTITELARGHYAESTQQLSAVHHHH